MKDSQENGYTDAEKASLTEQIERLKEMTDASRRIVFFGGAGVSTESGIPDFRSEKGIFRGEYAYAPEEIVSRTFFMRRPEFFYQFYKEKMMFLDARPNAAHMAIARLEKEGRLSAVVTQNIDGLHQMAGSKNVLELHGSIHRNHCLKCGRFYDAAYVKKSEGVPRCECGGIIKPDVVLYEEPLDDDVVGAAVREIGAADMLIIGGTSLVVYPAAGFIDYFHGKNLVVINKSETGRDSQASLCIHAPIGQVMENL